MVNKGRGNMILSLFVVVVLLSTLAFVLISVTTSYENRYTLIDGNDIISYDIIDGDTVIIVTENETYEVDLHNDVVDFTVSSTIHIELVKGYARTFFWNEFEPTDNAYFINRIIKVPDGGE